ncbi:MAG: response regulator transcription factor [Pirellulaceae bacterium]|jgi:DNA-binding NarL/FixJ family response regulator|nr:response regulator transcription factor [Pirellulaceae bacterium]
MAIKLIVVDDQEVVRKGLASLLAGEDIEIVAEAATGKEAISKTKKHKPDVLLMDVAMQEMDGLDAFERIRKGSPTTKVVMMSLHDNPSYVARAAALGASDFLLKDVPGKAFAAAIRRAVRGESPAEDSLFSKVRASLQQRPDPKADEVPLTRREYQVLRHLAYGLSNREIGFSLKISVETVKEHVQNILRKFDMPDRTAAAVWAVKRGLV